MRFVQTHLYKVDEFSLYGARSQLPMNYFCGEDYLKGVFTRFSNAANYVSSAAGAELLEAFSHYSYVASDKSLMVYGLQGVYDP